MKIWYRDAIKYYEKFQNQCIVAGIVWLVATTVSSIFVDGAVKMCNMY